jgi:hypothetical protein
VSGTVVGVVVAGIVVVAAEPTGTVDDTGTVVGTVTSVVAAAVVDVVAAVTAAPSSPQAKTRTSRADNTVRCFTGASSED